MKQVVQSVVNKDTNWKKEIIFVPLLAPTHFHC